MVLLNLTFRILQHTSSEITVTKYDLLSYFPDSEKRNFYIRDP